MKVFKVNLSVVYNDDEITMDTICDNMFKAISQINDKIVVLNIDDIKEMSRVNQAVAKMMQDIVKEPIENIKGGKIENGDYFEVNKSSSSINDTTEEKTKKARKKKQK
jgi:hypothetical protein